jgi:multidrug resistance efflux pump
MTPVNRLKLAAGLLGVLALVGFLTVVFNQRQSQVSSVSAEITAEEYETGIDYAGLVQDRLVEEGEAVAAGQPLLVIQSPSLQADLAEGLLQPSSVAYQITEGDVQNIIVAAPVDGFVDDLATERGSFVQAGQVLATVNRAGSLTVTAEFLLDPKDYQAMAEGAAARIILPSKEITEGTVESISVTPVQGQAQTTVRITSDALTDGAFHGLASPGTPVQVVVQLEDDGPLAGVGDRVFDFLRTIGL